MVTTSSAPLAHTPMSAGRNRTLAGILESHGPQYTLAHPLSSVQKRAYQDILSCRTPAMGARIDRCDHCGQQHFLYNSCRNRHCPQCGALAKEAWAEARRTDLLPVPYYHLVFTLPHLLNPLLLANTSRLLALFFKTVSSILIEFGHRRGGLPGATLVLHTWDQKLNPHFHLHCLIPAGYLSPGFTRWIPARRDFLFPTKALSLVLRCRFLEALQKTHAERPILLPSSLHQLADDQGLRSFLKRLQKKPWVVYAKAPCAGPQVVLDYLARYTHRTAISNHRITHVGNNAVSFSYRDSKDHNNRKTLTLAGTEFLRRFFMHILPSGFQRIRHCGFLANRSKKQALAQCRKLLALPQPPRSPRRSARERMLVLTGSDISVCPSCKTGQLHHVGWLAPMAGPPPGTPKPHYFNTS